MADRDLFSGSVITELIANDTYTSTETGSAVDVTDYVGQMVVVLHSKEGTGNADNTLNVKIQESTTSGGTYTDVTGATFTEVDDTAGGSIQIIRLDANRTYGFIKAVGTIAGTTPSFIFGVSIIGRKQVI